MTIAWAIVILAAAVLLAGILIACEIYNLHKDGIPLRPYTPPYGDTGFIRTEFNIAVRDLPPIRQYVGPPQ